MKREKVVPHSDEAIQEIILGMKIPAVYDVVCDDGSVMVAVNGKEEDVILTAKQIDGRVGHMRVGDGIQEGDVWINGIECDIHDTLSDVSSMDLV